MTWLINGNTCCICSWKIIISNEGYVGETIIELSLGDKYIMKYGTRRGPDGKVLGTTLRYEERGKPGVMKDQECFLQMVPLMVQIIETLSE